MISIMARVEVHPMCITAASSPIDIASHAST